MKKLVSIVIPTWQRHELLNEVIKNIAEQTYRPKELIIISDGPDKEFMDAIYADYIDCTDFNNLSVVDLGRNWSGLDPSSFGIAPLLTGYLVASGDYIMPWCDDECALVPDHIKKLVSLIEEPTTHHRLSGLFYPDFVYPKVHIWRNGAPNNHENKIIGTNPPEHGQITHYLFRADNLVRFGYPDWSSHPVDWSLIEKWMKNGAICNMLDEVTFEHRLDQ